MTGTGAVAIAVAATISGTLVARLLDARRQGQVRFGHPSDQLTVGAQASEDAGSFSVKKAVMSRSAHRSMDGHVFVPTDTVDQNCRHADDLL